MLRSTPSKSKENESRRSRRSSILKPRKPRKPLQNVDFDSPRNETSSTPLKIKRRVSFADKKHVKEFCHTVEQGTVWDNTYEENDSAKGSFVGDANAKTESRENKPAQSPKDATLSIIACNTSEKYMEPSENSQLEENMTNIKSYSCGNADFELNGTCIQDLSMEFTASISTPSLAKENINTKKDNFTLRLNLDKNYVSNSNNVSIQAIPVSARAVNSDLGIFEQISKIQNSESTNWDPENNTHAKTISSRNLHYSNIAPESTFFKQTEDATQNINESMMLTNVIQPAITDMSCTNAPFNVSMEMTVPISLKIYDENISHPHENIIKENGLREDQIDKTEYFNDAMEITKPVNVSLIAYNKENLRMDELILAKDDKTIFFQNASMEMTTVPLRNQQEITRPIIQKPISEENICKEKNMDNSIDFSEKTKLLCKSMEFTEAVPVSLCEQTNPICTAESTSFFQTISKAHSLAENSKLALQVDTTANKTIQHTSMEITAPVSSSLHFTQNARNERENLNISKHDDFQPLSVSTNNLLCPNKTVPVSLREQTNPICTTESTSFFQTISKAHSPAENSKLTLQVDTTANKTIQHTSMEITAPVSSSLHFTQNARNERENLNISKDDDFQPLSVSTNNLLSPNKTVPVSLCEQTNPICTAESTSFFQTISKAHSPAENSKLALQVDTTANKTIQHTSMEITAPVSSSLHFTQNARNERENLNISKDDDFQPLSISTNNLLSPNKTCKSFMEYPPQENNVHLERSNNIYMNNTEHSERFVKDTINYTKPFRIFEDDLNDISECSLLRKTLENGVEELQTIEPPSFISLDNDKEENSFSDALCKDKLQMSTNEIDKTINNICNSSNQLVINNMTQAMSRNSVAKDNESCTTFRENESINIENQMEDDCSKNIANETEYNQEVDCQVLERTIINGNLINESNHCKINVENLEENISIQNNKCKETKIDIYESSIIKGSEIIAEEEYMHEYVRERINEKEKNKEKEQYSDVQKLLIEQCTDPQRAEVIENQLNSEEYCKENLIVIENQLNSEEYCKENLINDAERVTGQNEENTEEQCAGAIEESLAEQDPFTSLSQELETYSERDDCIWNVYHENIDRKMIVFGFISNSLLVAMFLSYDFNCSEENLIKRIKIVSRISNDSGLFTKIVHKLILEKLDAELLMVRYKTREDILPMLEYVSQNVKLAMDFMFELKRLDDINLMEINRDQISFVSRSKKMDIIVKVIIKVKRFDELTSSDVNVHCLLGTIKETDVKGLIKNIKKDHMFLRKYMNDVKDYVDIIEMTMPKKCNY